MQKTSYLREIQKRLPDDLLIVDSTDFEFSEEEFISILSWIHYFGLHYQKFGKDKYPEIPNPIISRRLALDFGLYRVPSDIAPHVGKHIVYINGLRGLDGRGKKESLRGFIDNKF